MAYANLADLKSYLGISGSSDDALLSSLLDRATSFIEGYTGKVFQGSSASKRYDSSAVDGNTLFLEDWLLSASQVDNAAGTTIPASAYDLLPLNGARYYAIRLKSGSGYDWECLTETDTVTVTGVWGWADTPPDDIVHACIRLAAYYYRQKDAQVFDVTALPDAGVITIPKGVPADVKAILDKYRSLV